MNEKLKKDLIKSLFKKEFSIFDLENMYEYKGRVIFFCVQSNIKFIDFIEEVSDKYNIKGHEVARVIIEEFEPEVHNRQKQEKYVKEK